MPCSKGVVSQHALQQGGAWSGGSAPGGVPGPGESAPWGGGVGCLLQGGLLPGGRVLPGGDPPAGWLLLQAVRMLLECILVLRNTFRLN